MLKIDVKEVRKQLHKIPELAFQEKKTKALILSLLQNLPNIIIHEFKSNYGLLIEYKQGHGDYLLFRADMDALPIQEKTGCDFSSQHAGIMHACGHDVHMAILIGLIHQVVEQKPQRNLLFLFQPAEEGQGGAESILSEGIVQSYPIKSVFALHVTGKLPLNTVSTKAGIIFALTQEFDVEFWGKGAHVAFPEQGKNALSAGIAFYQNFAHAMTKIQKQHRCLFNIGKMQAGSVRNIIPDYCRLEGTHRTLDKAIRTEINDLIYNLTLQSANEYEVKGNLSLLCSYDPVNNDENLYKICKTVCQNLRIDFREAEITMTGEDFGYFTSLYKGLLFWLGANDPAHDVHSDMFLPDDNCIETGISVFLELVKQFG